MRFIRVWLSNHVLANLSFFLVLLLGTLTYFNLPREQDPTINFNWVQITTIFPGASAEDVEKRITEILEDSIRTISDIRFVSSVSRDSISSILVRFHDISEPVFEKKLIDLRREIQNKERLLPEGVQKPEVIEITSSNAFPSATIAIVGKADDNQLRIVAKNVRKDLERIQGVDRVDALGLRDSELQSYFFPNHLAEYGITSTEIANSIAQNYQDIAAGSILVENARWLVRWLGTSADPSYLNQIPVSNQHTDITLAEVAKIQQGREKPSQLVLYEGKHAIILTVMKKGNANILKLVDKIQDYVHSMNAVQKSTGVEMVLLDDQTQITKNALSIMETNAVFGLLLVAITCWIFLGFKISLLVSLGIPFSLCATFLCLDALNQTLNVSVLLGLVIALGMLVDDTIVVVEAIQYRLERGYDKMRAILEALQEVFAPVCSSVMTTIAAFLPLMLMPGILGKFMLVIPLVVCLALIFSLIEAFWMLPAHINALHFKPSRTQQWREKMNKKIRFIYIRFLTKSFRYPKVTLISVLIFFTFSLLALSTNLIKFNFFASDPIRLFYVNVEMHSGTPITETLRFTEQIENTIRPFLQKDEARSIASYAGIMFTEMEPVLGEQYGQVIVSLHPQQADMRSVSEIIDSMRLAALSTAGPKKITFMPLAGGPPTAKPINIKIRGDNFATIRAALNDVKTILQSIPSLTDIADNDTEGQPEIVLKPNLKNLAHAKLNPEQVSRMIRLLVDGEVVRTLQEEGEELQVRVRSIPQTYHSLESFLQTPIASYQNGIIRLQDLVHVEYKKGSDSIRHYNFRKAITITADIDKNVIDTVTANQKIQEAWLKYAHKHPSINLEFSGELDDIEESLHALPKLFILGLGLMYLILGTQFKSYWQPFIILFTIPLGLCGVVIGLLVSKHPMSLFTLYGMVALTGIAVNASIVLISAANERLQFGMKPLYAILFAARRRVIPILMTSSTTVAGLFSLAVGLGGKSLLWGPIATAIVWGLLISTFLTLLVIPLIYLLFMRQKPFLRVFMFRKRVFALNVD